MVAEGLAEAFAVEQCGEATAGMWTSQFSDDELTQLRKKIANAINVSGFDNVRGYMFGDATAAAFKFKAQGMPDMAGYAIGYHVVKAYMAKTGKTAAEATYIPWQDIIQTSCYFK